MRFIVYHTNSNRASVNRVLKELINKKIIVCQKEDNKNIYILNENLSDWDLDKLSTESLEFEIKKAKTKVKIETEPSEGFFKFFNNYPWRIRYKQAMEAWMNLNPSQELENMIIQTVEKFKTSEEWKKNIGIPAPDTFLINERWRDELTYNDWRE